jgi:hypothetical protein
VKEKSFQAGRPGAESEKWPAISASDATLMAATFGTLLKIYPRLKSTAQYTKFLYLT